MSHYWQQTEERESDFTRFLREVVQQAEQQHAAHRAYLDQVSKCLALLRQAQAKLNERQP